MPISRTKKIITAAFLVSGMASITGTAAAQDIVDIVVGIAASPLKQDSIILDAVGGSLSYHVKSNDPKLADKVRFRATGDNFNIENSKEATFGPSQIMAETSREVVVTPQPGTVAGVEYNKAYNEFFGNISAQESVRIVAVSDGQGVALQSSDTFISGSNTESGRTQNTTLAAVTQPLTVVYQDDTFLGNLNLQTLGHTALSVDLLGTVLLESVDDGRLINGFDMTVLPGPQGIPISTTPADNLATITSLLPALPLP